MLISGQQEAKIIGKPFAVCVVDAGGHVLASFRDVTAAPAAGHSAESKARTAAYLHADTGGVPATSPLIPALTSGLPYPVNVMPGGVVLRLDGTVIGAVAAAGSVDPAEDARVAKVAASALDA